MFLQSLATKLSVSGLGMAWDLENFKTNFMKFVSETGSWVIMVLGLAAIIFGVYQLITGLMSHGKKPTNWFIVAALILVGGAFMAGGIGLATSIGDAGSGILDGLGQTVFLPFRN